MNIVYLETLYGVIQPRGMPGNAAPHPLFPTTIPDINVLGFITPIILLNTVFVHELRGHPRKA